jgi:pimeloyl-ACP methyl ester carboxylesterase
MTSTRRRRGDNGDTGRSEAGRPDEGSHGPGWRRPAAARARLGKADGPPILFIRGWSQNHLCWSKQHDSALADQLRLVLPAMAGHVLGTCPTAEGSWYDSTGHVLHLEEPGRFNRELAELTRRTCPPRLC